MKLMDKRPRSSPRLAITLLVLGSLLLAATCVSALAFSLSVRTTKAASDEAVLDPNFSGRWQMDTTASDLPSPSPEDLVEVIEQRESRLKITTTSKDWTIQKPIAVTLFALTIPEFSTNTDDQETVQKYGPGELGSKTRWEGKSLVTEWTLARDGHAVVIGTCANGLESHGTRISGVPQGLQRRWLCRYLSVSKRPILGVRSWPSRPRPAHRTSTPRLPN